MFEGKLRLYISKAAVALKTCSAGGRTEALDAESRP